MRVAIYVAMAENGVIGRDGDLPWRLSGDLKRFKLGTMGKPIVMGRRTWESFPRRPLPGRLNIVVTRDQGYAAEGGEVVHSLGDALTLARIRGRCQSGADEICIIGGGQIYSQAMPLTDRLYVTHVLARVEGDTWFPAIDPALWSVTWAQDFPAGEKDSHATRFVIYDRKKRLD